MSINVFVNLKSVGKRRPILKKTPYTLSENIPNLRQLIEVIVRQEVLSYNTKGLENMLIPFLTETEISDQATVGKVGFGRLYSDRKADPDQAVGVAIQGFEDGLFKVLIDDIELPELDSSVEIQEGNVLTFIRLTFLAGRLW